MTTQPINVLVLCTGNSARSILGEALINRLGNGRIRGFSAGSFPKGQVHPGALRVLQWHAYPTDDLRSKSWDEFTGENAPPIDIIITVCDNAAGEACPIWPGRPASAHWGLPDPAAVEGDEGAIDRAFERTYAALAQRIIKLVELPLAQLSESELRQKLQKIHEDALPVPQRYPFWADVVVYHNPMCATSRNTLAMIRSTGVEPHVIEYLKTPPERTLLVQLLERAGMTPRQLLREKGTPFAELGLGDLSLSDDALLDAMMAHPILINRPLVVSPLGVALCRPSETVLALLDKPLDGDFTKEDGEVIKVVTR